MIRHFRMSLGKGLRNKINVKRENLIMDKKNLLEIVENVEKEDLIEIICFLVNKNPKLERNLLEYCQKIVFLKIKRLLQNSSYYKDGKTQKNLLMNLMKRFFIMSTKLARQKIICFHS